jgi:Rrf2 family transcriptional regulator, iron-sulfur cluster assembly transcription factor
MTVACIIDGIKWISYLSTMKLSTRSRYGTRILLELSRRGVEKPVQVSQISKKQGIPVKYLEQLIRILKQAGLVTSVRGPKGGHIMTKHPSEITLGQLVRLFEGQTELVVCISEPEKCAMSDDCRVRLAWMKATEALYQILDATTIEDVMQTNPAEVSLNTTESSAFAGNPENCWREEEGLADCLPCLKKPQE